MEGKDKRISQEYRQGDHMKTLSIRQPWASMIIQGYKPVENRPQQRTYRGPLLIHAGKKYDYDGEWWIKENFKYNPVMAAVFKNALNLRGGIIGSVNMIGCVTEHDSPWFSGPYGFVFIDPKPLEFDPMPGKLSFFEVPGIKTDGQKLVEFCDRMMGCDPRATKEKE